MNKVHANWQITIDWPVDAKVTIVEFVDFSDSYSHQLAVGCHSLMMRYPGKVHGDGRFTARTILANLLSFFLRQQENKRDEATYLRWAKELNPDIDKFQRDRNSTEVTKA